MMKKRKLKAFLAIVFIVIICLAVYIIYNVKQTTVENAKYEKVCFKRACFDVEIAQTAVERERGLMFRETLCYNCGMLFMFEQPGIYSFWMKNTLIPLDMLWINESKTIVYIKENASPCKFENCESFIPSSEAIYVLEINAGIVEKYNLSVGDNMKFE